MKRILLAALACFWVTASAATNAPPAAVKKTQAELDEIAKSWVFPIGE